MGHKEKIMAVGYQIGPEFRAHFYVYRRELFVSWTWDGWQSGQAKQLSAREFNEARDALRRLDMTAFQEVVGS
jgi:hypothetical protein